MGGKHIVSKHVCVHVAIGRLDCNLQCNRWLPRCTDALEWSVLRFRSALLLTTTQLSPRISTWWRAQHPIVASKGAVSGELEQDCGRGQQPLWRCLQCSTDAQLGLLGTA